VACSGTEKIVEEVLGKGLIVMPDRISGKLNLMTRNG
jgi:hypothetical protein